MSNIKFTVAVEAKAKHGIIYKYMQENDLTIKELASEVGISESTLIKLLNLKKYPNPKYQRSRKILEKLCKFFKCKGKDLFPKEITKHLDQQTEIANILQNKQVIYREPDLEFLADYKGIANDFISYEQPEYEQVGLKEAIEVSLNRLSEREKKVLDLRFGLGLFGPREAEHTLEEVALIFGVTRERIRQIEGKACRKLRHPINKLGQYVG